MGIGDDADAGGEASGNHQVDIIVESEMLSPLTGGYPRPSWGLKMRKNP
jgi:hypothetical protein